MGKKEKEYITTNIARSGKPYRNLEFRNVKCIPYKLMLEYGFHVMEFHLTTKFSRIATFPQCAFKPESDLTKGDR
ncbi:Hypothetical predicted protein [Octopus vulgaris]|uniref:Uncharacterized protein n=1 Tax=Octopus vulgaris TaxID=6645 RepID=A0AA36BEU3_OCTVU|nr:Hypothetical predicted protein [Octopus vulgaris]